MRRSIATSFGLLFLGVALGAVLRFNQVTPLGVNAGNATHAHSHTLYWGWAGLMLFTLFFERVGATGRGARIVLGALGLQALATFFVFLHSGYGKPGVVLSALTLLPFLAAVITFFRAAWGKRGADLSFLRAAVIYVVLAYVSAISRVVLKVLQIDDPVLAALAVHLFLGAFGAFFTLGVMGLTIKNLGRAAPHPDPLPAGAGRGSLALVLGLTAPLIIWPQILTLPGIDGPLLGLAKISAIILLIPAAAWSAWVWRASAHSDQRWLWRSAAFCWSTGVLLLALVASSALSQLIIGHHAVILVVHLQTLGVVTSSLLLFIEARHPAPSSRALWTHQAGLALMLSGLGWAALSPGRPSLVLAALGGVIVVAGQAWSAARFLLPHFQEDVDLVRQAS
jgi:hypothetical protein